jgi:hypothetical protein
MAVIGKGSQSVCQGSFEEGDKIILRQLSPSICSIFMNDVQLSRWHRLLNSDQISLKNL